MAESILETDIAVIGAGGCGLTAALVAAEHGKRISLFERDNFVGGSTAMSAGIFVAAGSQLQHASGEYGTPEELALDIFRLNGRQSEPAVTQALCNESGPLMDWLVAHGVPLEHMPDYRYPGMSRSWIHSPPQRDGSVIIDALMSAVKQKTNIQLYIGTRVTGLISTASRISGLTAASSEDTALKVHATSIVLSANGFGANTSMVSRHIPELAGAPYYGAKYATGDAIQWGQEVGAAVDHLTAYQSHSSIAFPKKMLVTTYLINNGAIQVNRNGLRFGDETDAYAEHALSVQAQPDRVVVEVFDERILEKTLVNYPRFAECLAAGIVRRAETIEDLAVNFELDRHRLVDTIEGYNSAIDSGKDEFGRVKFGEPLKPPYYGIRVTSALVQTLGGLRVNERAQVVRPDGTAIPGLYAGGGTASGVAGDKPQGYLAGTGLLAAFGLGWIAGHNAAQSPV